MTGDKDQSELNSVSRNQHESVSQTSSNLSNRDSNSSDIIVITSSQSKCSDSASVSVSNSFKYTKLASESGYSISSSKSTTDDTSKVTDLNSSDNNKSKMELVELNSPQNYSMHRELPVDVPDSFVGVIKQTPRYPPHPPQPPQRFSTLEHNNQLALSNRINNEKLRKYSDEIYRKKDEEEFLRTSIRDSKKLQQLQELNKMNHMEPMVNIAFEPDDEVLVAYNNTTYGSVAGQRNERESDKGKYIVPN